MFRFTTLWTAIAALTLGFIGCTSEPQPPAGPIEVSEGPPELPPGSGHAHPSEGPHHGSLIELGNEEYHAELVHDEEAGSVTIYILDGSAKKAVAIEAQEITINLKHDGKPAQFKLNASPDANDPDGKSSRFVSEDKQLAGALDAEGADARLVLKIEGKSYNGSLEHSHDHAGHKH